MMIVYKITNKVNSRVYVGLTEDFERRKYSHLNSLAGGIHYNLDLQNDFDLGHDFEWEIILERNVSRNNGNTLERDEIAKYPNCYNKMGLEEKQPITIYLKPSEFKYVGTGGDLDKYILDTIKQKLITWNTKYAN